MSSKKVLSYYSGSILFSFFGLVASAGIGYYFTNTLTGALQALFIASVLAVLEISLSFDNAIVNSVILKKMTPLWQKRFLTWGILIAVFGMRLVFPLLIVAIAASIGPWEALKMAALEPQKYAELMLGAHLQVSAFGGAFLLMVCLKYFYDENKDLHWIRWLERPLAKLGKIEALEIALCLGTLLVLTSFFSGSEKLTYLEAGLAGLIVYVVVDGIGSWLEHSGLENGQKDLHKASAGMFLYLEVLDASFSFDGVVGAFAITNNLFIIMIGLSIGAFFVRSMTIMLVEKNTLSKFSFLEHGAFYAIGILALIMLTSPLLHIPEWFTGLVGAFIILISFIWSVKFPQPTESSSGG